MSIPQSARQSPSSSEAPKPSNFRFRIGLGMGRGGQGGRGRGRGRSKGMLAAGTPVSQEQAEHAVRLHRYGLDAEAVRRLSAVDRDFAPSGALLRDICSALLRLAAGRAAGGGVEQPRSARLQSEENEVRRSCVEPAKKEES